MGVQNFFHSDIASKIPKQIQRSHGK